MRLYFAPSAVKVGMLKGTVGQKPALFVLSLVIPDNTAEHQCPTKPCKICSMIYTQWRTVHAQNTKPNMRRMQTENKTCWKMQGSTMSVTHSIDMIGLAQKISQLTWHKIGCYPRKMIGGCNGTVTGVQHVEEITMRIFVSTNVGRMEPTT